MDFLAKYWEFIVSGLTAVVGIVLSVISFVARYKQAKASKDKEALNELHNELKGVAFGLINIAEHTFSDIPGSGASKLVYVLEHIKKLCEERNVPFEEAYWTDFVNGTVTVANAVQDEKVTEAEKQEVVEQVKKKVPEFVQEANRLFVSIPNSTRFKIAYVISLIEEACEEYEFDVFNSFDWHDYVTELYGAKEVTA